MCRPTIVAIFLFITLSLQAAPVRVLVTLPPIKFFVEAIGGNLVEVETLVPKGAGAHTYEPTPKQVQGASAAEVWFVIGEPLERRVENALPNVKVVDLRVGLALRGGHCSHEGCTEGTDPHFWLSPQQAKIFSHTIAEALIEAREADREEINGRLEKLEYQLQMLDGELRRQLAPCRGETILVSHPAFGYFCDDYDLHQLAVEFEGKEPTPRQVAAVVVEARHAEVKRLILDTQYSAKGARLVAEQLDIPVCPFDPLSEDYFANMHRLATCVCHG
jgi:zinc transport system substrate-binding protein